MNNPIQKLQLKAVDQIGGLMADLTFETDPTVIQVQLGLIAAYAKCYYKEAEEINWVAARALANSEFGKAAA